jgi:hypothetical protein
MDGLALRKEQTLNQSAMTTADQFHYLPRPRSITALKDCLVLQGGDILCDGPAAEIFPTARLLQEDLRRARPGVWAISAGAQPDAACQAILRLDAASGISPQGYRLHVDTERVDLSASDAAGLFYGVMTLRQMLRQCGRQLPACRIEDFPDFPSRGVMLDVSRSKVPTLETLFALVDMFAEWKINQLQLYTEHAFAYRKHRAAWVQNSPMTGEEILCLDAYCKQRHVELVPCQNSFGHMEKWLRLPEYRHLAEASDGLIFPGPEGDVPFDGPFGLAVADPRSLEFVSELYDELLPHFSSRKFNVCCDEAFDSGQGRSRELCERLGKGKVYLEHLLRLHEMVTRHGRTMYFWGDMMLLKYPELLDKVPKDAVLVDWYYETGYDFDSNGARLKALGLPFCVAPGTSAWAAISGRTQNALQNLSEAASAGRKHGAIGYLITDWGSCDHLHCQPVTYLPFAAGAGLSWCAEAHSASDFLAVVNQHVFHDSAEVLAKLAHDLGNAYLHAGKLMYDCSVLNVLLLRKPGDPIPTGVTEETLTKTEEFIRHTLEPLDSACPLGADGALILREFANTGRMLLHACDRSLATLRGEHDTPEVKARLAAQLREILGEFREIWVARNRVGGIHDATRILMQRYEEYMNG